MKPQPLRVVALISGSGSNLQALIRDAQSTDAHYRIVGVVSNRPDAGGLEHARKAGIPHLCIDHREFESRTRFDEALAAAIDHWQPDVVVLAGFMRVLTDDFVNRYLGRMINIHPALLPAYPGLNTHQRVLDDGAAQHGASVHYVIPDLDAGPVIIQARLDVQAGETAEALAARVLKMEHRIYPQALRWLSEGRVVFREGNVYLDGKLLPESGYQTSDSNPGC